MAADFVNPFTEWLKEVKDRKFFGYIHFREPHTPLIPPAVFLNRFGTHSFRVDAKIESNEERELFRAAYDANIAYVDNVFRKILESLKFSGLLETTTLVISADHGEAFWQHGVQDTTRLSMR
jgi:membrane-anchored protein YejM (alkaline phosphatase superfamily)